MGVLIVENEINNHCDGLNQNSVCGCHVLKCGGSCPLKNNLEGIWRSKELSGSCPGFKSPLENFGQALRNPLEGIVQSKEWSGSCLGFNSPLENFGQVIRNPNLGNCHPPIHAQNCNCTDMGQSSLRCPPTQVIPGKAATLHSSRHQATPGGSVATQALPMLGLAPPICTN